MMKALPYVSRFEPAYEAKLSEWIEDIRYVPFSPKGNYQGTEPGWLYLSTSCWANKPTSGHFYVKVSPALNEAIQKRSIFCPCDLEELHEEHGLEIYETPKGFRLMLKFQKVSGTYCLSGIGEEELLEWLRKALPEDQRKPEHKWLG